MDLQTQMASNLGCFSRWTACRHLAHGVFVATRPFSIVQDLLSRFATDRCVPLHHTNASHRTPMHIVSNSHSLNMGASNSGIAIARC